MKSEYIEPPIFDYKHFIAENEFLTVIGEISILNKDGIYNQYSYCDVWKFRDGKMTELYAYVIEKESNI